MPGRRMERIEWTRQVVNTALEKEPTRAHEYQTSVTRVSRKYRASTCLQRDHCKPLKLSNKKEIRRMFEFSAALSD